MICRTCSINSKKIFGQNVGKVVRLTENADIALLHQNVAQLCNMMTMPKQACQTVQTSDAHIFASNFIQDLGKVCPLFNTTKKLLLSMKIFTFYETRFKYETRKDVLISEKKC